MFLHSGYLRLVFITLVLALASIAQTSEYAPPNLKTEIFGGFSTLGVEPGRLQGQGIDRIRLNGWTATITSYQFFRRWGLTAELSGNYGTPDVNAVRSGTASTFPLESRNESYMFGGTYPSFEKRRIALTGRILAGLSRWRPADVEVPGSATSGPVLRAEGIYREQTAFTFGFGQSIDLKLSERVAIRVQPDLRFARIEDESGGRRTNLQLPFSVGVVYKFGRR